MTCAIYCRLSREDDDKYIESESIQNQRSLLVSHALTQGWEIVEIYCDEEYSGADSKRPAFLSMIQAAKESRFDIILCKTQSRFTRDMELVERYIHGLFPEWGIRFVSIADHVDTGLKGNKKARQINGLINEWYLEDLSENIRMVFAHKRSAGLHIGSFALYGYEKDPKEKGKLIVDPVAAQVVKRIFHLACLGHGKQSIANILNADCIPNPSKYKALCGHSYKNGRTHKDSDHWNKSTINRILHNEMYLGTMVQGKHRKQSYKSKTLVATKQSEWFYAENTHEAIIDKETFETVQTLRGAQNKTSSEGDSHVLSGFVLCHSCGYAMQKNSYRRNEKTYSYLRCSNPTCKKKHGTNSIRLEIFLSLLKKSIEEQFDALCDETITYLAAEMTPPKEDITKHMQNISHKIEQHKNALTQAYLDKLDAKLSNTQFELLAGSMTESIQALTLQMKYYKSLQNDYRDSQTKIVHKNTFFEEHFNRMLYKTLIKQIYVEKTEPPALSIHIHWNF